MHCMFTNKFTFTMAECCVKSCNIHLAKQQPHYPQYAQQKVKNRNAAIKVWNPLSNEYVD